MKDSGAKSK
jgi:hypothetical protein